MAVPGVSKWANSLCRALRPSKGALLTLTTQFGIQFIGLATGVFVARLLGPEGRGELAAVLAWVGMLVYTGNLGLPVAYTFAASRDPQRLRQLLGNGLIITLIQWSVLIFVGLFVLRYALAAYSDQTRRLAMLYLCLYVPLNLFTLYSNALQQGLGLYRGFNAVRLCVSVSYFTALAALFLVGWTTITGVLAANLFSNLATLILALCLIWPRTRGLERLQWFDWAALKKDIRYGVSAHLGTLQPFTGLRIDVLLLTVLLTPYDLGLYVAALAGAGLIKAQGSALGMVLMPEVAKNVSYNAQRKVIGRFVWFTLFLSGSNAVVALLWAEPLIVLVYGESFSQAATLLRLLVLSACLESLNRMLADGLRGMGRPLSSTAAELAALIVGIPAILWLVPISGVTGAAVAVGLASIGSLAVTIYFFLKVRCHRVDAKSTVHGPEL